MAPLQKTLLSTDPSINEKPNTRVVTHLDMDCFYAQVEHRRLNIPRDQPLGVQQYLNAVNYAAKAYGVRRGDLVSTAKTKCPTILCVHVEVIGDGSTEVPDTTKHKASLRRYREASNEVMSIIQRRHPSSFERASIDEAYVDLTEDVNQLFVQTFELLTSSLGTIVIHSKDNCDVERSNSNEDLKNLFRDPSPTTIENQNVNNLIIQESYRDLIDRRPSIVPRTDSAEWTCDWVKWLDEIYNKVSILTDGIVTNTELHLINDIHSVVFGPESPLIRLKSTHLLNSHVVRRINGTSAVLKDASVADLRLLFGALFVHDIRSEIEEKTAFTVSAGISHNKFMAKEISATHKPNAQTVVLDSDINEVLKKIKVRDARGLRGKTGEFVLSRLPSVRTLFDLQQFSFNELRQKLSSTNGVDEKLVFWIYSLGRGTVQDEVKSVSQMKSMLAVKTFAAKTTFTELDYWVKLLCKELSCRLEAEYHNHHRVPRTIVIHQTGGLPQQLSRTRSAASPTPQFPGPLSSNDLELFMRASLTTRFSQKEIFPCTRLGVAATDLTDASQKSILKFTSSNAGASSVCSEGATSLTSKFTESNTKNSPNLLKENKREKIGLKGWLVPENDKRTAKKRPFYLKSHNKANLPNCSLLDDSDVTFHQGTKNNSRESGSFHIQHPSKQRKLNEDSILDNNQYDILSPNSALQNPSTTLSSEGSEIIEGTKKLFQESKKRKKRRPILSQCCTVAVNFLPTKTIP